MTIQTAKTVAELREQVAIAKRAGRRVGCVPTMGALHAGHESLLVAARRQSDFVVATIFVNPTQFAPGEDLERYPRPLEDDLSLCDSAGVDTVFLPSPNDVYPQDDATTVQVSGLTDVLEGRHRPTHFAGVTTVVAKLFGIVQPDVAFFGEKDFQQLAVLSRMTADLFLPIEVVGCPIVRDADGLALSSRNRYLSPSERTRALELSRSLESLERELTDGGDFAAARDRFCRRLAETDGLALDYAVVADPETLESLDAPRRRMVALVAATVGTTRLIDNRRIELLDNPA